MGVNRGRDIDVRRYRTTRKRKNIESLEEMLKAYRKEMQELEISEECMKIIPEEYRWTEYEECIEEWKIQTWQIEWKS